MVIRAARYAKLTLSGDADEHQASLYQSTHRTPSARDTYAPAMGGCGDGGRAPAGPHAIPGTPRSTRPQRARASPVPPIVAQFTAPAWRNCGGLLARRQRHGQPNRRLAGLCARGTAQPGQRAPSGTRASRAQQRATPGVRAPAARSALMFTEAVMTPTPLKRPSGRALGVATLISVLLSGCAQLRPDAGFEQVDRTVRQHLNQDLRWARNDEDRKLIDDRVTQLLAKPLSVDDATQLALLNHRGLQAAFDELGIAEADRARALSLPNPGISVGRTRRAAELESELSLHFNLARLLTLPLVAEVESSRIAQLQADTALRAVTLATEVRKAWVQAVAAVESVRYARQVMEAAAVSAELARRMAAAGNFNKLQHAREQSFQADAALNLARAEQWQTTSRERLTRLLGLWGGQIVFTLPERLPDPPARLDDRTQLEAIAIAQRLDVQGAKLAAERTARSLGLTRATRFINVLEVGTSRERSNEAPDKTGWEISLELPIFDTGSARLARAEAVYRQALNRAADTAITARSEVR
ncbi:MAG: TolC family protein, partial [Betaproteobacteria bacterium]|nr:TolC family protein [Betaproteobacteria bacterium]